MHVLSPSRRQWLAGSIAGAVAARVAFADLPAATEPFGYCLNTATIRGQSLSLVEQVELAARAGYRGIEPWVRDLEAFAQSGGDLKDIAKRVHDRGLSVESAIGFAEWAVDDEARRRKGLEQARRDLSLVAQIGGKRLAAPPAGVNDRTESSANLHKIAERYRRLSEVASDFGVVPQVEIWGFSRAVPRIGDAMLVAMESGYARACVLADIYHLYKGGSDFGWVHLVGPAAFGVIHVNDYPAKPVRAEITDAYRVYPGDGVAPLASFFRDLIAIGFRGMLSLELFNREYWRQDALAVARTGLDKLRAVVRTSLAAKP
jgi:sugar phosphate isomerase/epimerase